MCWINNKNKDVRAAATGKKIMKKKIVKEIGESSTVTPNYSRLYMFKE